jgi:formylglycine-generating enzyme required for sulfatase activity
MHIDTRSPATHILQLNATTFIHMLWIPAGSFRMGSPDDVRRFVRTGGFFKNLFTSGPEVIQKGELGRDFFESAPTQQSIERGFWLSKYPITNAQWACLMSNSPEDAQTCGTDKPNCPKAMSWQEVNEFLEHLNQRDDRPEDLAYRLPSEIEWEYACRAGTESALNNGKNLSQLKTCPHLNEVAWYARNSSELPAVGAKAPNRWGLHDMHGTIHEWCVSDDSADNSTLTLRGGSYQSEPAACRSAAADKPEASSLAGLRLCLAPQRAA